jgi:hypothetical protein
MPLTYIYFPNLYSLISFSGLCPYLRPLSPSLYLLLIPVPYLQIFPLSISLYFILISVPCPIVFSHPEVCTLSLFLYIMPISVSCPYFCILSLALYLITMYISNHLSVLWRTCSFTPIHSLTGPVGQPFASCLGGSSSGPGDAPTLTMEPGSPVSDVSLHWWPRRYLITGLSPFSGCFTRLHADDVKRRQLCHAQVGASRGFAPTM